MSGRLVRWVATGAVVSLLLGGASVAAADPAPPTGLEPTPAAAGPGTAAVDDLPNPLEANRRTLRDRALQEVLTGKRKAVTKAGSRVVKLSPAAAPLTRAEQAGARRGRPVVARPVAPYVELSRARTDRVFVLLVEFGDQRASAYPDTDTDPDIPGPQRFDGPAHNTIPRPDRRVDNTTIWERDFGREYYQDLYFGSGSQSMKSYWERQSSGRYSIEGQVSDWVTVPFNQARYGRSNGYPCAVNVCANSWYLVRDALQAWVAQQQGAGRSDDEIKAELASYDVWDRYDHDGDGFFNEPDGYLDHLQIVHAGGDQAADDPDFGEDAIWSHRWRAFQSQEEGAGPAQFPIGGTQVGSSGIWAADYTMQAENAGLSVFAHEYGHDLGLPDHYDTAGGGDNPVNWWTLMGQSRLKARRDAGVGTRPGDLGAWDKLQLGWLDYAVVEAGEPESVELGPHEYNSDDPQALIVPLPAPAPTPRTGSRQWWSGTPTNAGTGLARVLTIPTATDVSLTFQTSYNIQDCAPQPCDAAYVDVNDGSGFRTIPGTITAGSANAITGFSNGWVPASFDLSAYAGKTIALRFRYSTDAGGQGERADAPVGLFLDDIAVTADGAVVIADGAEGGGANGWVVLGFVNIADRAVPYRYYLASYRTGLSYDRYLATGPYHFGWATRRPRKAEFFPYGKGLLVSYWDTSYADNNTSVHPGAGRVLPIDAKPAILATSAGQPWRGRIQTYDAPFSLRPSKTLLLHDEGRPNVILGTRAQPLFDDTRSYWRAELPNVGVKTPGVGVTLRVTEQAPSTMTVQVGVSPDAPAAKLAGR